MTCLRALLNLRIVRIDWPFPALELVRPDGTGWLLLPLSLAFLGDVEHRPVTVTEPAGAQAPGVMSARPTSWKNL